MSLAIYIKEQPIPTKPKRRSDRIFFSFMALVGLVSVVFAAWPYIIWQITTIPKLTASVNAYPIPKGQVLSVSTSLKSNVQIVQEPDGFSYFTTDYKPQGHRPDQFLITIPKLKIEKAQVKVDNLRFAKHLSHFPGSAIPGEAGNAFVTGHSVLPQFYDPKNFKAIFSKLDTLEIGDDVYAEVDGKTFHFLVQYAKVVDPKDLSVLKPISTTGRNLTLMTCVPPGTNIKRLVVITSLI